jgi:HSP20 family protein
MDNNAMQAASPSPVARSDGGQQTQEQQQQQQRQVVPPVDVFETEAAITLLADLPGVRREQLQVRVDGDNLVVEAVADTAGPENMELVYGELQCPAYRRQFTLSRELDTARIEAQLRDGVLRLTIPKAEDARPRRIQVQAG